MPDFLRLIWDHADLREPVWSADEVALWPDGTADRLLAAGLLLPTEPARSVVCDACSNDHLAEVTVRPSGREGEVLAFLRCAEAGRVRVPLKRLCQWALDLDRLATEVCRALDLSGEVAHLVQGRVWRLGKRLVEGESRLCVMLRGLGWPDGVQVLGRALSALGYDAREVCVFVPGDLVPPVPAEGETPHVIPLGQVLALDETGLKADASRLGGGKRKRRSGSPARISASYPTPAGTDWPDVEIVVSDFILKVTVKGKSREYGFEEAGFEDRRKGKYPNAAWELLKVMATYGGVFPTGRGSLSRAMSSLKQSVSQLGKILRALLHIDDIPFHHSKKGARYEAKFRLSSTEKAKIIVPDGTTWD